MVIGEGLKNSWEKKRSKRKRERYPTECTVSENSKKDKKAFLTEPCKEIEENNRTGKTRERLQENWKYQRNISCKNGDDKGNSKDFTESK